MEYWKVNIGQKVVLGLDKHLKIKRSSLDGKMFKTERKIKKQSEKFSAVEALKKKAWYLGEKGRGRSFKPFKIQNIQKIQEVGASLQNFDKNSEIFHIF